MTGQDAIKELRRSGRKPMWVYINDYPCATGRTEHTDSYTVSIDPTEAIEALDLRFLIGLKVNVAGSTEKRARALLEACKLAGAVTVAVTARADADDPWSERNYAEIWHG
jgi:hypothetical protein